MGKTIIQHIIASMPIEKRRHMKLKTARDRQHRNLDARRLRILERAGDIEGLQIEQQIQDEEFNIFQLGYDEAANRRAANLVRHSCESDNKDEVLKLKLCNEQLNDERSTSNAELEISKQKIEQLESENSKLQKDNTRTREALDERDGKI